MANVPLPLLNFRRYLSSLAYRSCLDGNSWHNYMLFSSLIEPIVKLNWRHSSENLVFSLKITSIKNFLVGHKYVFIASEAH